MALKMGFLSNGKEPSEMDLVMKNISQTEEEMRQKIFQLGQMYYEDHKSDTDTSSKYYNLVDALTKLDHNRVGFYKNKLRLQGKMLCENCGSEIPYGSIFCSICGKRADEKQEGADTGTSVKRCAQCGTIVAEGDQFCASCGTKIV